MAQGEDSCPRQDGVPYYLILHRKPCARPDCRPDRSGELAPHFDISQHACCRSGLL